MAVLWTLESGFLTGAENMALDDCLLNWVRASSQMVWVVRTYQWTSSTVSLGQHQPEKDIQALTRLYQERVSGPLDWVKRPTGGRAILHGEDIAFSFVTNDPVMCQKSLQASYTNLSERVQEALKEIGVSVQSSDERDERAYIRSAVCFETHTQSDLLDEQGQKIAGSAQCRRAGGILQHGSAFIPRAHQSAFAQSLFAASERWLQLNGKALPQAFPIEMPEHWPLDIENGQGLDAFKAEYAQTLQSYQALSLV